MKINFDKYQRKTLNEKQRFFLDVLMSYCIVAREWIVAKSRARGIKTTGIPPSIICADILLRSNWGTHPAAKDKVGKRKANNLALLESNQHWKTAKRVFSMPSTNDDEQLLFRSYENWEEFFQDLTDYYSFSGNYDHILEPPLDTRKQLMLFSYIRPHSNTSEKDMLELINKYGLDEFDTLHDRSSHYGVGV